MKTRTKLFFARILSRWLLLTRRVIGRGSVVVAKRGGLRWTLDLTEGIDLSIYLLGGFDKRSKAALRRLLKDGASVVDIGANIGSFTLPLAQWVGPRGKVVAVEATDWAMRRLRANLALNPEIMPRVTTIQALLLDRPDAPAPSEVWSSWPLNRSIQTSHGGCPKSCAGAEVTTLDELLRQQSIDHVDLVKLDVDGHEVSILEGATSLLSRCRPLILMEMAPALHDDAALARLVDLLADSGYCLVAQERRRKIALDRQVLRNLAPPGSASNVLAMPEAAGERWLRAVPGR